MDFAGGGISPISNKFSSSPSPITCYVSKVVLLDCWTVELFVGLFGYWTVGLLDIGLLDSWAVGLLDFGLLLDCQTLDCWFVGVLTVMLVDSWIVRLLDHGIVKLLPAAQRGFQPPGRGEITQLNVNVVYQLIPNNCFGRFTVYKKLYNVLKALKTQLKQEIPLK